MADTQAEVEQVLVEFIARELRGDPAAAPGADDDLLGSGLVDSLGVMRLVRFVEERYGVAVPPADVTIENFNTARTIASYLAKLG